MINDRIENYVKTKEEFSSFEINDFPEPIPPMIPTLTIFNFISHNFNLLKI